MYRVYSAQVTRFGKPAVVITTSFRKSGKFYGEMFCIFLDANIKMESKIIDFGWWPSDGASFALTEEFVLEEALERARVCLKRHIQNQCLGKEVLMSSGELGLDLVDIMFLVRLWVRVLVNSCWIFKIRRGVTAFGKNLGLFSIYRN